MTSVVGGLLERGHRVRLYAPALTRDMHAFAVPGLDVRPWSALPALGGVDVVHAHGYRAAGLVLPVTRLRRLPLLTTWHNAILGRGSAANAILGRGSAANAILGRGSAANAILGRGSAANAILGRGSAANAILGRGSAANAILGRGSAANAILGRGSAANAGRLLQRVVARGSDLTLGASSDLVAEAERLGARCAVLAPVAAPALPPPRQSPSALRAALGAGPADVVVLSVTRLAPQKNLDLLLDLAATFPALPALRFVVVGEGPLRAQLAARIRRERLPVALPGASDDVASFYAAADVVLLTSAWEARSLVAQEALLAGVPLVATRVGGTAELVGEAALLFDPADPAEGRRALEQLAADAGARSRLAQVGRRQAKTWPDEAAVVDDLVRHYRRVLRDRP